MRVLITGAGGFAGGHLAEYLRSPAGGGGDVWGVDRGGSREGEYLAAGRALTADLRDPEAVRAVIRQARPDRVYHLAGQAFVGDSWADPWATLETNLRAQINVCEALLAEGLAPRVLVLGSMEEYGRVAPEDLPIKETQPLRPDSPYGVSKVGRICWACNTFSAAACRWCGCGRSTISVRGKAPSLWRRLSPPRSPPSRPAGSRRCCASAI